MTPMPRFEDADSVVPMRRAGTRFLIVVALFVALQLGLLAIAGAAMRPAIGSTEIWLAVASLVLWLAGIGLAWGSVRKAVAAEAAAHASEHRFRAFAEAASDWFWETTPDLRISYLSERFEEATGVAPELLIGRRLTAIGLRVGEAGGEDSDCIEKRQPYKRIRRFYPLPDGSEQCWMLSGLPILSADGLFLGYRGTGTNVSAEIAAQLALEAAKAEAESASRAKTEFLAHISHEFRTPLNAIMGFSELIRDAQFGPVSARYAGYADDIHNSGQHLLALVTDMLDLSKIEAGHGTLDEEELEVGRVVASVASLMRERLMSASLTWTVDVAESLPNVRADERRLKQMLINLMANAVKFTPAGGHVLMRAWLTVDGGLGLQVRDNGIGIAPHHLATALAPYGQIDNSLSRRLPGTGLGLSLTKAMAELHGGSLTLESAEGSGTTVTILLPPERVLHGDSGSNGGPASIQAATSA